MRRGISVERAEDAEIIRELGRVWKQAADLQAAFAVFLERKRRLHEVADRPAIGADRRITPIRRAVEFCQGWLEIKGVHLTGGAVHEQKNGVLGPGREMGFLRRKQVRRAGLL